MLYIHIPFCLRKCNYCDFTSFQANDDIRYQYADALRNEIKIFENKYSGKTVRTIFFGGGTPSILKPQLLESILQEIASHYNIATNCEISIEANPATNCDTHALRELGFNRISIGVQSFVDAELKTLARLHNSTTAIKFIEEAKKHFNNLSIDLIYGIPKQTQKSLTHSINTALSLQPKHISAYNLIVEPNTTLYNMVENKELKIPSEKLQTQFYHYIHETLSLHKYHQYEVSNYALHGYKCEHNLNYWRNGDYIGFGLAAHSHIKPQRFHNTHNLGDYIQLLQNNILPRKSFEHLTPQQTREETIFLGLRAEGIPLSLIKKQHQDFVKNLIEKNLAQIKNSRLKLTPAGRLIMDSIVLKLI